MQVHVLIKHCTLVKHLIRKLRIIITINLTLKALFLVIRSRVKLKQLLIMTI